MGLDPLAQFFQNQNREAADQGYKDWNGPDRPAQFFRTITLGRSSDYKDEKGPDRYAQQIRNF